MTVSELMSRGAVSVCTEDTVYTAAGLMLRYDLGCLPVLGADGRLRGVLTDRDVVLRCVAPGEDPSRTRVKSIMTRRPVGVLPEDDVRAAAEVMARSKVRRLPVTAKDGALMGVVSLGDLARCGTYEMEASRALTEISGNIRRI